MKGSLKLNLRKKKENKLAAYCIAAYHWSGDFSFIYEAESGDHIDTLICKVYGYMTDRQMELFLPRFLDENEGLFYKWERLRCTVKTQ